MKNNKDILDELLNDQNLNTGQTLVTLLAKIVKDLDETRALVKGNPDLVSLWKVIHIPQGYIISIGSEGIYVGDDMNGAKYAVDILNSKAILNPSVTVLKGNLCACWHTNHKVGERCNSYEVILPNIETKKKQTIMNRLIGTNKDTLEI